MAKRKTAATSKSAAIREYISANPNAGPTEIYDALTKQGIKVGDVRRLVEVRVTVERLMSDFNGRFVCCQERAFRQLP